MMSLFPQQLDSSTLRLKTTALLVRDSVSLRLEARPASIYFLSVLSFLCWFPDPNKIPSSRDRANTFQFLIFDPILLILSQQCKSILGIPESREIMSINFFLTYLQCSISVIVTTECIGKTEFS